LPTRHSITFFVPVHYVDSIQISLAFYKLGFFLSHNLYVDNLIKSLMNLAYSMDTKKNLLVFF